MTITISASGRACDAYYSSGAFTGSVITLTVPLAAVAGDGCAVIIRTTGIAPATPSGFTLAYSGSNLYVYTKVVGAGEATYRFTTTSNYIVSGIVVTGHGADPTTPVPLVGTQKSASASTISFDSLTMPRTNCMAIQALFDYGHSPANSFTPSAGFAEAFDGVLNSYASVALAYKAFAASGASGTFSNTVGGTGSGIGIALAFQPPPPATVTSVSPAAGGLSGGTTVTIEGTGFTADCTVDIGGAAATSVVVVSATQITCVTPARTAGAKTVTVTNAGGDGTLASGYTYTSVVDANVKLLRGGSFVGDDKASATEWPGTPTYVEYGGPADLWGTTWTPAQVNASDFGVGMAATVASASQGRISHIEMEVAYSLPHVEDPQTYLAVLKVDDDRNTTYPAIYRLPRSGFTVANDPSLDRAVSGASLWSSRIYEPSRYIEKTWRAAQFYVELDPSGVSNTVGFQVWASVDDGTAFQLRDADGNALTVRTSGPYTAWFPPTDAARGKWVQIGLVIPDIVGDQVAVAVDLRNISLRFNWRPERTESHSMPLDLGEMKSASLSTERRSPYKKLVKLFELAGPGKPPVAMRDELGRDIYVHITDVSYEEVTFKNREDPNLLAYVTYRIAEYS